MPMGPFTLLDQIGLDTAARATRGIETINEKFLPKVSVLSRLVESERLGVKNGRGFYHYRKGRRLGFDRALFKILERQAGGTPDPETIQSRLYLPMVNEAVRCLAAGVARQAADVDLGLVLGTGFPPFRGGPLRNADTMGIPAVVERMNALAEKFGERLAPEPILVEMGLGGRRFYPDA
jgi:3-hydroxyacyl-CoA dehydrogenase